MAQPKKKAAKKPKTQESTETPPKKRMGRPPNPNKGKDHRMSFKVENHLWDSLQLWSGIYKQVEGKARSPNRVAKAFIVEITKHLDEKLKNGEIDLDNPDCRLP